MKQTRRNTLKVKDLVTGKTMTVEEWKQLKAQRREQPATDESRSYGPHHARSTT